jgi:hypothetical protein
MRAAVLTFLFIALAISTLAEARNCTKGIPCGASCISATKTCRIGGSTSAIDSYRSYAAPAAAAGTLGAASLAAPRAAASGSPAADEALYVREDTDIFDQPARNGAINGRLKKGTRVTVYQVSGVNWVRIPPERNIQQRWVRRDALQSSP